MHIPDGFMNAGVSAGSVVAAAGGIAYSVKKSASTLDDREIPLAGVTAAFIFAVQMLNFPVAAGTSGHLLGGVLAAVLVSPYAGAICVAVVLIVQAFFADGGVTALGLNIVNMALVTTYGGYAVFFVIRRVLPRTRSSVVVGAGIAGFVSVVLASIAFTVEYALGGTGNVSIGAVATAMVGVHGLIGIGEGIITALTVGLVLSVRPDLVYGARDLLPDLQLRSDAASVAE